MTRHSWGESLRPDLNNTRRTCKKCGLLRITRHEPDNEPRHWTEFEMEGRKVVADKTPVCESAMIAGLHPLVYVATVSLALWAAVWWLAPTVARAVVG